MLDQQLAFILVCREDSHTTLYDHLAGMALSTVTTQRWTGKVQETWTYRYLNGVPLRDGADALLVNWCELTVSRPDGQVTYHNAFATSHQHLASFLATLNILSLLFHTALKRLDQTYTVLRAHLPTGKTFFEDLRALTRYLYFDSWDHLLTLMLEGLELETPPHSS